MVGLAKTRKNFHQNDQNDQLYIKKSLIEVLIGNDSEETGLVFSTPMKPVFKHLLQATLLSVLDYWDIIYINAGSFLYTKLYQADSHLV